MLADAAVPKSMGYNMESNRCFFIFVIFCFGCSSNSSIPVLDPADEISVIIKSNETLGIKKDFSVKVDPLKFLAVYDLIEPKSVMNIGLNPLASELVAEVSIKHLNGKISKIYVREMGHNPAGVSFDDKKYYFGGPRAPDGALEFIKIFLQEDPTYKKGS